MHLGMRPRIPVPDTYKGFRLVRLYGLYYGLPPFLASEDDERLRHLLTHPAVLRAPTLQQLQVLIDSFDESPYRPELVESDGGYDLVRHGGAVHAVPRRAQGVDLSRDEERRRAGVVSRPTVEEVRECVRARQEALPVEFAGWLPIFEGMGNCGRHPQFTHTDDPPPGYRFTQSLPEEPGRQRRGALGRLAGWLGQACGHVYEGLRGVGLLVRPLFAAFRRGPRVGLRARVRLLASIVRLFFRLWQAGGKLPFVFRFVRSRHYPSQILLADPRALVFLTSVPYTYNQSPWVIEIEDPITLFFPFIQNGQTYDLCLQSTPWFPLVRALLESRECKGILTHVRSTARLVPKLFGSEEIARKVFHVPLGVKVPQRWQRHEQEDPDEIHLLYINSWCQHSGNFQVRGGLDVLEAFATLRVRYPQLRLTMRTSLPALDDHYHRIIEGGWVRLIHRFMPAEELAELHAGSHIFLLPAARIHVVSLLQAMSYGLAVVASDGWGIEEYLEHGRNGLVVKGRYGVTSWADEEAGVLREDYEPTYSADPVVVEGLVEAVSRLVEDAPLRRRLGRAARADVESTYNLARWNDGLKAVFDQATR